MQNYIFLSREKLYFIIFHLFILKILIFDPLIHMIYNDISIEFSTRNNMSIDFVIFVSR